MGGTAVPGLEVEPVIDIPVSVQALDLGLVEGGSSSLGHGHLPMEVPGMIFFRKGATPHLPVCGGGGGK